MRVVGTETQNVERQAVLTGVQRVVTCLNDSLLDELAIRGMCLRPMHTWPNQARAPRPWAPFLEESSLLQRDLIAPEEASLCLFLDWSLVNFPRLARPGFDRIPKVFFLHDVFPATHPEWFPPGSSRTYRFFLRQVLAIADHIICATRSVVDDLLSFGWETRASLDVIGLGSYSMPKEDIQRSNTNISMLYVSTLEPRKGHHLLLDAFDRLLAASVDVELVLVGRRGWDVPPHWQLETLTRRIFDHPEFGRRLRWYEGADDATVRSLGSQASIGVVPAEDEGFGLFIEEALGMGLKVVASDIPVFAERPHPNLMLSQRTPEALARAILASHETQWAPISSTPIRTLRHTACELADLLDSLC